jgi:Peptidase family M23
MHTSTRRLAAVAFAVVIPVLAAPVAHASGSWLWPVEGPILRGFDPPDSPYGSGHRGIDIGVPVDTAIAAPDPGTVTFAGKVGGHLFLTINHGGGLASTYSWLSSIAVHKGDPVTRGQVVALSGPGHPGDLEPSLHLGVKLDGAYVDPLRYLGPIDIGGFIRLAPLVSGPPPTSFAERSPPMLVGAPSAGSPRMTRPWPTPRSPQRCLVQRHAPSAWSPSVPSSCSRAPALRLGKPR